MHHAAGLQAARLAVWARSVCTTRAHACESSTCTIPTTAQQRFMAPTSSSVRTTNKHALRVVAFPIGAVDSLSTEARCCADCDATPIACYSAALTMTSQDGMHFVGFTASASSAARNGSTCIRGRWRSRPESANPSSPGAGLHSLRAEWYAHFSNRK